MLESVEAKRSARRLKSRGPTFCCAMVVGMTISSTGACQKLDTSEQGSSIVIDHEVLVPGLSGKPNAMAQLTGGGFVLVGAHGAAWAAGTDAQGKLLWKYEEPLDPNVKTQNQSEFHGVVPLANGGALLCGEIYTKDYEAGLLLILDSSGRAVERLTALPNNDRSMFASSFMACFSWGKGIAVTGVGADGHKGFAWLVKLNKDGVKEWEKFDAELPGINGVALADNSLILMGSPTGLEGVTVASLNQKGVLVASNKTKYLDARPVRSVGPPSVTKLLAVDSRNGNILVTLNGDLQEIGTGKRVGPPSIRDGCAYTLTDGSVVLFGNRAGSVYRSAIGWINRGGRGDEVREMPVPIQQDASFSMRDAVSLSANQFVAMRDQVSSINPANTGVVLSWVTFK
jgi:hypothetical protein